MEIDLWQLLIRWFFLFVTSSLVIFAAMNILFIIFDWLEDKKEKRLFWEELSRFKK